MRWSVDKLDSQTCGAVLESRCSAGHGYLLSYLCTYLPLQDKYCYYSLHVSKHMDHCQGDQRWWQGILVRLVQLISHYPVDKWIDNTLVSVFVDSHEVWICSTFLILQIYKLQFTFTQVVHCKKKKYCIFIPFNITSRDEHFTLPVSPCHPGHQGQWCLAQINGALQSRGYNS